MITEPHTDFEYPEDEPDEVNESKWSEAQAYFGARLMLDWIMEGETDGAVFRRLLAVANVLSPEEFRMHAMAEYYGLKKQSIYDHKLRFLRDFPAMSGCRNYSNRYANNRRRRTGFINAIYNQLIFKDLDMKAASETAKLAGRQNLPIGKFCRKESI